MQKIIIKNFNQVKLADIEISKILCLIGEQASGKSTIAKLIYFFKSLKAEFLNIFYEVSEDTTIVKIKQAFINQIKTKFAEYFGVVYNLDDKFEVIYYFSHAENCYIKLSKNQNKALSINFSKNYWSLFENKAIYLLRDLKQSVRPRTSNYLLQTRIRQGLIKKISKFANGLFFDERETIFFPSGRCLISMINTRNKDSSAQDIFLPQMYINPEPSSALRRSIDMTLIWEYIGFMNEVKMRMSSLDAETKNELPTVIINHIENILKGKYANEDGKERIYYDESHYIPLYIASSGQQDVIGILLDIIAIYTEKQQANRIIEEPETHLFPNTQRLLVELLVSICNLRDTSYIVTTHSPFVLAALNNILYLSSELRKNRNKLNDYAAFFGQSEYPEEFINALCVKDGDIKAYNLSVSAESYCTPMIDKETGLIGENVIDESSESIYGIFDNIFENS